MPRKHKHKLGTAYRRNYDPQNMEEALRLVLDEHMSFQQAADSCGVPKSTLYSKYKGEHNDKLGRPPAIPVAEEKLISKAVLTAAEFGVPFTPHAVKDFVQQFINRKGARVQHFVNNRPGDDWCESFMSRNPELSLRHVQNIKRCRAEVNRDVIVEYLNTYGKSHMKCLQ